MPTLGDLQTPGDLQTQGDLALSTMRKRPHPPSICNLRRIHMVGGLKRPENFIRGPYVDWFESYCGLKIPFRKDLEYFREMT